MQNNDGRPAPPAWPEDVRARLAQACRAVLAEYGGIPLEELLGPRWAGSWSNGAWLFVPGWKPGFEPEALRALFWQVQDNARMGYELCRLQAELARREAEYAELEARCAFYRRQVGLEARLGLMLARLAV